MNKKILSVVSVAAAIVLSSCYSNVEVPKEIHYTGRVENVVTIELKIPDALSDLFKDLCEDQCLGVTDCTKTCVNYKENEYITAILNLIAQYQSTVTPSAEK